MQTSSLQLTTHPDVYVERARNGWAIVRLNRPKSLHALDESLANAFSVCCNKDCPSCHRQHVLLMSG